MRWLFHLREWFARNDVRRARQWQTQLAAAARTDVQQFQRVLACPHGADRILFARARGVQGEPFWAGVLVDELLSQHTWTTGSTGTGKSFLVLGVLLQLLSRTATPVVVVDHKGELATLLLDILVPALATTRAGERILAHLRVIRPFDETFVPMLRITEREPHVHPEVQAFTLAATLEEALGEDLGARMRQIVLRLARLAIELDEPFTTLAAWLDEPSALAAAAQRSTDGTLARFVTTVTGRESRSSVEALRARLDTFFFLRATRRALSAPRCVSFGDALDRGLTVVDVGEPPAGAERVARFWAGALLGRLTRAILSRQVTDVSPRTLTVFEEFQEGLARHQVDQFGRLLALARYKRVALWFVNQEPSQVASVDPSLVRALRTNTGIETAFRCNVEDARAFAHALPVPTGERDVARARHALVEEMTRLPRRTYRLWLRQAPFRAQKVRAPRIDLDDLRVRAATAPTALRTRIRKGTAAMDADEFTNDVGLVRSASDPGGAPEERGAPGHSPRLG